MNKDNELFKRLTPDEIEKVYSYAYMFDDIRGLRQESRTLQEKLNNIENIVKNIQMLLKGNTNYKDIIKNEINNIEKIIGDSDEKRID